MIKEKIYTLGQLGKKFFQHIANHGIRSASLKTLSFVQTRLRIARHIPRPEGLDPREWDIPREEQNSLAPPLAQSNYWRTICHNFIPSRKMTDGGEKDSQSGPMSLRPLAEDRKSVV